MKTDQEHDQGGSICVAAPKWAALVGDRLFPMPRRNLTARDILDQSGMGNDCVLVRDHGSPHDVILNDSTIVDLAQGNVFRVIPRCEAGPQPACRSQAKLAFACDDAWKVTLVGKQTGHSLKRLFDLPEGIELFRDYESPSDKPIADGEQIAFDDGPVFTIKRAVGYCINIESTTYPWKTPTITVSQIRELGNLPKDQPVVCEDAEGSERTLREDEVVTLDPCCRFGRAPKYKRG